MAVLTLLLPGTQALLAARERELPQKDQLCGAFWGLLALRGAAAADQETVALAAGSVLGAAAEALPPGESGRADFRVELPRAGRAARSGTSAGDMTWGAAGSGTSAAGVARSVVELSNGARAVVPVSGEWSGEPLRALLERLAGFAAPLTCIANVVTDALWGTHPAPAQLLAYLETGDADAGPPPDWDVGHFVGLLGLVPGCRGTLVVVADSYRSLGHDGVHLQPAERIAAALESRGLLLAVEAAQRAATEQAIAAAGLRCGLWDNGSPDAVANA